MGCGPSRDASIRASPIDLGAAPKSATSLPPVYQSATEKAYDVIKSNPYQGTNQPQVSIFGSTVNSLKTFALAKSNFLQRKDVKKSTADPVRWESYKKNDNESTESNANLDENDPDEDSYDYEDAEEPEIVSLRPNLTTQSLEVWL